MVASGKGLLAMDESTPSCCKRFDALGVACTPETRRRYREMLVTAPGLEQYISGAILFDETIRQKISDGTPMVEVLARRDIIPGIKVDTGAHALALHAEEKITEGLDGLRARFAEYATLGARFAKWRAVITIGKNIPTDACIHANAHALARYAALAQEADIVPVVEPEVLLDGDHTIDRCYEVVARTLRETFKELRAQGVYLEGTILKSSMVLSGKENNNRAGVEEVAQKTVACILENVPPELAGVVFLSGGQGDEEAAAHLNAMHVSNEKFPWRLTFSYSRSIQRPALKAWAKDPDNFGPAQQALVFRSRMCSLASQGKYSPELEKERRYEV